ncbi:uncharacterized protein LOC144751891 [Ciona intestinalis]
MFFHERKTYDQSRLACQQINSDLVIIRDAKLQNFITPYLDSSINATLWNSDWYVGYWIGGTRQASSSTWYWWDGSFLSSQPPNKTGYNNWFGVEPNGVMYASYCIYVTPYFKMQAGGKTFNNIKGGWVDDSCGQLKYYICKTGPCFTNRCLNNGSCIALSDNYKCNCKPGFSGSHCEKDLCTTTPCKNGGTCSMVGNNYTCSCVKGFVGKHCENDICSPSPCNNGGTCIRISNHYICSCPDGSIGSRCDIGNAINENNNTPTWGSPISIASLAIGLFGIFVLLLLVAYKLKSASPQPKHRDDENLPCPTTDPAPSATRYENVIPLGGGKPNHKEPEVDAVYEI